MNKIKRGVSLLLCSLLFGSAGECGRCTSRQTDKDRDKTNNK